MGAMQIFNKYELVADINTRFLKYTVLRGRRSNKKSNKSGSIASSPGAPSRKLKACYLILFANLWHVWVSIRYALY